MNKYLPFTALAALALITTGAIADVKTSEDAPVAAKAETPQALKERVIGEFGPWTALCVEEGGPDSCLIRQTVDLAEKGDGPKLHLFVERSSADSPVMLTVGAPLGVSLQPGASLVLNENDSARVWHAQFETCLQEMCLASAPVNVTIMKDAESPLVSLGVPGGDPIGIKVVMSSIEEALEAIQSEKDKISEQASPADAPDSGAAPAVDDEPAEE